MKAKGTRLEHKTIQRLKADGWQCWRSSNSLGPCDVIAMNEERVRLIEVRSNQWRLGRSQDLLRLRCPENVSKEIWRWDDGAREPKVKML